MGNHSLEVIKIKKWNFLAMIVCAIELVMSIIDLPTVFYNPLTSVFVKVFSVSSVLLYTIFFVLFLRSNKLLRKNECIKKYPYFFNLVWTVISVLYTIITSSYITSNLEIILFTLLFILLMKIPVVMTFINIFKVDIGEIYEDKIG